MLLEKLDIFFNQVIIFVHRMNYCTAAKMITLQTQIILLASSKPFLIPRKWVYFSGKLTKPLKFVILGPYKMRYSEHTTAIPTNRFGC